MRQLQTPSPAPAILTELVRRGVTSQDGPIWSLLLFGSRARGDNDPNSDTDVLLVTPVSRPRHANVGNYSLSFYAADDLRSRARAGDLFVCHLVREARVLFDSNSTFDAVRREFRLRNSYREDIERASELGWFLYRYGSDFANVAVANRKVAWCVRTILIARAAETRQPMFSLSELEQFAQSANIRKLVKAKELERLDFSIYTALANFLVAWGTGDIPSVERSPSSYARRFGATCNSVGLHTYRKGRLQFLSSPDYAN